MPSTYDNDTWTRQGLLVTKRVFTKFNSETRKRTIILTLVFVDKLGNQFEISSYNQLVKAFCVYKKVHEGDFYEISGSGKFYKPDQEFSTSAYKSNDRRWWIKPLQNDIPLKKFLDCSQRLNDAIEDKLKDKECANVLGTFQDIIPGPGANYINGKPTVFGYFVIVTDKSNVKFQVLVWHTPRVDKAKFDVSKCKKGDPVLFIACRPSYIPKGTPKERQLYTITTIFSPVVEPSCMNRLTPIRLRTVIF